MANMFTWRKCVALILTLAILVSFAGCGQKEEVSPAHSANTDMVEEPSTAEVANVPVEEVTSLEESGEDAVIDSVSEPVTEPMLEPTAEPTVAPPTETVEQPEANTSDDPVSDPTVAPTVEPTITEVPTAEPSQIPTAGSAVPKVAESNPPVVSPPPTVAPDVNEESSVSLTSTQRDNINMLNYMSALTQRVNEQRKNQLFLETAYDSFENLYPNAVDTKTQAQITSLMDTIQSYRMISLKRARLEYIYEQNRAQAMRQAIPNPLGLLSAVQSGSLLKAAVSVLYMAVDSASSYSAATSQADRQFIQDGWELDDAESSQLHESTKAALSYLLDMVRKYDLPGDYALNRETIEDFVTWSSKPNSQLVRKISWLEAHQETYKEFGPYWLELVFDYYNAEDYEKCFAAIKQYELVTTRIFRKDIDYATALPMAIISAREILSEEEYVKTASRYCTLILSNTKDADWSLKYFAAQIYVDLFSLTNDSSYLDKAYKIAYDNVVVLVDKQKELNSAYTAAIVEEKPSKDATKREKEELKEYNKLIKEERKTALPPVNEALYLNCDLLFALAEKRNISASEQRKIDSILHENGGNIFLTEALDARFWFTRKGIDLDAKKTEITFNGAKLVIPVVFISDRSKIVVTVSGPNGTTTIDDWTVKEVKRPKNAAVSDYAVTLESKTGKDYKYQAGETVTIKVVPVEESPDMVIDFVYKIISVKKAVVFKGISFERVV